MDGKAEALFFDSVVKGATLAEGLQMALEETIAKLADRQGDGLSTGGWLEQREFRASAHGLVALHGEEIVPIAVLGLTARRETLGHRFEPAWRSGAEECRQLCAATGKRRCGDRQLRRTPCRDRQTVARCRRQRESQADEDDALLERSDRAVERPMCWLENLKQNFSKCRRNA